MTSDTLLDSVGALPLSRTRSVRAYGSRAADVLGAVLLMAFLWWLPQHDGGYPRQVLAQVAFGALLALPLAAAEARRVPRPAQILVGAWALGSVLAVVFAAHRTGFVDEALRVGVAPVVGLVALRIWRRRWGPGVLTVLLLVAFGLYTERAFLAWWGSQMSGGKGQWMALSWWNQSGALTLSLGLFFGGVALAARRVVGFAAAVVAGAGLVTAWYSGSRGTVVVGCLGIVVLLVGGCRALGVRRTATGAGAVLIASVVIFSGMNALSVSSGGDGKSVVTERTESLTKNGMARIAHSEAALRMFVDRPLLGQGPGAYRYVGREWSRADTNLTTDPHNRYAQALGETGLAGGLPFLLLSGSAGWLVLTTVLRRSPAAAGTSSPSDQLRIGLVLGASAAVSVLLVHQGADFDWLYPVLPGLLAIGIAILLGERGSSRTPRWTWGTFTVAPIGALLVVGLVGLSAPQRAGSIGAYERWDAVGAERSALHALERGSPRTAAWELERALWWNPGNHRLHALATVTAYLIGDSDRDDVVNSLSYVPTSFALHNAVAAVMLEEEQLDLARTILGQVLPRYHEHAAWNVEHRAADSLGLLVRIGGEQSGCAGARAAAAAQEVHRIVLTATGQEAVESTVEHFCRHRRDGGS